LVRETVGASLILLVALIALRIFFSVRKRRLTQETYLPRPASAEISKELFNGLYVATVFADKPLDRVWAYGLGGRGKAQVGTNAKQLVVARTGEVSIAIPFDDLIKVFRGGATIDRGVERGGLIQVLWRLGGTELITSFRVISRQEASYTMLKELVGGKNDK
jgi:hypothetical protein